MFKRLLNSKSNLIEAVRYTLASVVALLIDTAILIGTNKYLEFGPLIAAFCGFSVGIIVIYYFSIQHVFSYRKMEQQPKKEFIMFFISGLVGLVVTLLSIHTLTSSSSFSLLTAKIITSGFVFLGNFLFRKLMMFTDWKS